MMGSRFLLPCLAIAFVDSGLRRRRAGGALSGEAHRHRDGREEPAARLCLAFKDVLVKVSGDPRLLDDPRVEALAKDAGSLVAKFTYRDRMEGIPIHDEQGLARPAARPDYHIRAGENRRGSGFPRQQAVGCGPTGRHFVLGVKNGDRTFLLSSDGERGIDMRDSLAQASAKIAIPATLPSAAALQAAGLTHETLPDADAGDFGKARDGRRRKISARRLARLERQGARLDRRLADRFWWQALPLADSRRQLRRGVPQRHARHGAGAFGKRKP